MRRIVPLAGLLLLFLSTSAPAAVLDEVKKDFAPLSGYVIMPVNGEYLIDRDASSGVSVGDLFSVVKPGEKIVHPVTKEVLGSLDEVKGLLEVTRVKSGYSYARPVGETKGVDRGDVVRRYENVAATFWDYTGRGESFYTELKTGLPALEWRDYAATQAARPQTPAPPADAAALIFLLKHDGLEVRGPGFQVIRAYATPASIVAASPPLPKPLAESLPATPVAAPPVASVTPDQGSVRWEKAPDPAPKGVQYEATFPGYANIGALPDGTVMADFVDHDGRLLVAATDGGEIRVLAVEGGALTPVAFGDTSRVGDILSVHWWQPDAGGPLYLASTVAVELNQAGNKYIGHKVIGAVFRLDGERLVPVREEMPYILGAFDRDGDGRKELLLGQSFDREIFFGKVRELRLEGGDIESSPVNFELPPRFTVQGSLFLDVTGDGRPETVIVRNRVLSIYDGEELIYESPQQMGGSLARMTYELNPGSDDTLSSTEAFELSPVASDLDGDGTAEIVAVGSEASSLRVPGIGPGIQKSWLTVIKQRGDMFVKGTIGEGVDTPVQGLAVTDDAVFFVSTESSSLLGRKGKSHLLSFPLK